MIFKPWIACSWIVIFTMTAPSEGRAQESWEKVSAGLVERNFECLAAEPQGKSLFLVSDKNLYKSLNGGSRWEHLFRLDEEGRLNWVRPDDSDRIFLLSTKGLLKTEDGGKHWRKIFTSGGESGANSLALSSDPRDAEILFLGTGRGLYWSLDEGGTWVKETGMPSHETVQAICHHPSHENLILVATRNSLYRSENFGQSFKKILNLTPPSDEDRDAILPQDETVEEKRGDLPAPAMVLLTVSPYRTRHILLATSRDLFLSRDLGESWHRLPQAGLSNTPVHDLAISPADGTLFVATASGIFFFHPHEKRWLEIYEGLAEKSFVSLELVSDPEGETLYAASDHSVYRLRREGYFSPETQPSAPGLLDPARVSALRDLIALEPSIREVQQASVRYAGMANGKIRRWQWASRLKALVPDLSISKDLSTATTVDIDRGATNTPDSYITGPDSFSKGEDLRLVWSLSDLVWSSDQTSIDSRAKLTAEFRGQVLSEVTRLYFERRRLLIELYLRPPPTQSDYLDLLLRIDELTGYLDALTGGYLSQQMSERKITYR